jgi:hypothetical protein
MESSVSLPGVNNVVGESTCYARSLACQSTAGLWPAIWTLGNLGRAGYGASLEGMVCYSYFLSALFHQSDCGCSGHTPMMLVTSAL